MSNENKIKRNQEEIEAFKKVTEYKRNAEFNLIFALWGNIENYYQYGDILNEKSFSNKTLRGYYVIGRDIILKEKRKVLDEITVGEYLVKHEKLKELFENNGGFSVTDAGKLIDTENMDSYVAENSKWCCVINLYKRGFPIASKLSDFTDMSGQEIYEEYTAFLNDSFQNVDGTEDKAYKISYQIDELIDKLDEGNNVGLPLYNMPLLSKMISGLKLGEMVGVFALSGVGKSSLVRNTYIPSVLEHEESCLYMINEESLAEVQVQLLVWVANVIFKKDVEKWKVNNGKYSPEFKHFLKTECVDWIREHENQFLIVPFSSYSSSKAIKLIKKYSALGFNYFIIDTFKQSQDSEAGLKAHEEMQRSSVELYDTIKDVGCNVNLIITGQLTKGAARMRSVTQSEVGIAKNIQDVMSKVLYIKNVEPSQRDGGKNALSVFKLMGSTKVPVKLSPDKQYQVITLGKNRGGRCDLSLVVHHDLSRNVMEEIGYTIIMDDY